MKSKIPNPIEKREILHSGRTRPEELAAYGRSFFESGRLADALDFFHASDDNSGIEQIKQAGKELGDSFLFRRLEKVQPQVLQPKDWEELGDQAWKMGKYSDALEAFSRSGNLDKQGLAKEKLGIKTAEEKESDGQAPSAAPQPDSLAGTPGNPNAGTSGRKDNRQD